jgi:hypothetical protein
MEVVRFPFAPMGQNEDLIAPHIAYSESLNVPLVQIEKPHGRKLAVVGGGPSVKAHLKRLRRWDGDIWAINGAVQYLLDHGIKSVLFTVDPCIRYDFARIRNAESALLSAACEPRLFNHFSGHVQMFYMDKSEKALFNASGGCSSATRVPMVAINMGYRDVTYFGCEGSYDGDTHGYQDKKSEYELWIEAGGRRYRTDPTLVMQCQYLTSLITAFPKGFKEKSGGLLRAMIEYPDTWTMTQVSGSLKNRLEANFQGAQL